MWLNDAKFMDNGRSGYVAKPNFMNERVISFNPGAKMSAKKVFYVKVISAFQLPKVHGKENSKKGEIIDPYVKTWSSGVALDRKLFKTKVVSILYKMNYTSPSSYFS